jgi:hypothetical protein
MHRFSKGLLALALVAATLALVPASPVSAQEAEELCQPGFFSATGTAPCTAAPPGSFVDTPGAIAATSCSVGTFQPLVGQTSCTLAPAGKFVDTSGATTATPCPVGTFQALAGQTSCTLAPAGTYVDTLGAVATTSCPSGTDSPAGSDDIGDCVPLTIDADADGVPDAADRCAGTDLSAGGTPRTWLRHLLWSNGNGDFVDRDGRISGITVADTRGCSAAQIVADLQTGSRLERTVANASTRFGFLRLTLQIWIATN